MNAAQWQSLVGQAVREGLLPEGAAQPEQRPGRPWPVVLLSFLGALLAALPLAGFVFSLFGDELMRSGGLALGLGALLLAGGALLLRRAQALFVEHLALVLLLLGLGLVAWALTELLTDRAGLLAACALALGVAAMLPAAWVRLLLGACAALLAHQALSRGTETLFWAGTALLLAWAAALGVQHALLLAPDAGPPARLQRRLQAAARLDALLGGWMLAAVATIALATGTAMLVGASLPFGGGAPGPGARGTLEPAVAVALLLGGALALAPRWPLLRTPVAIALSLAAATLAAFMPALAGVGAAGLLAARSRRPGLAAGAALAAAWIVGSFYYSLDWPLTTKALVLAGTGIALGLLVRLLHRSRPAGTAPLPGGRNRRAGWTGLALVATLAAVNAGIWQKEALIAHGRPVYIELAPVDPRSLMQGDYMALAYRLEPALEQALHELPPTARPLALARIDARGIARLERLAPDAPQPLAPDELPVALKPKNGRWVVASDAWFFAEGEARRFEPARYGEFRIAPGGEALLVGLADKDLRRLGAPAR